MVLVKSIYGELKRKRHRAAVSCHDDTGYEYPTKSEIFFKFSTQMVLLKALC